MSIAWPHQRPNCILMTTSKELRQVKEGGTPPFVPLAKTLIRNDIISSLITISFASLDTNTSTNERLKI